MAKKSGITPSFVEVAGESVEGLYFDKGLNSYYFYVIDEITGRKRKITRRNKAKAALELYNYNIQKQEQKTVTFQTDKVEPNIQQVYPLTWNKKKRDFDLSEKPIDSIQIGFNTRVPESYIFEQFVEMLDTNPRKVSETFIKMGREDLASIIHLPKNFKVSRTKLTDLLEWYLTNEERSRDTIRYATKFWNRFSKIVNVLHMEQITLEHIKEYKKNINETIRKNKLSKNYAKTRYEYIRRIFKHAKLHMENKNELNRVIDNLDILQSNGVTRKKPTPISQSEFRTILDYVTEQYINTKTIAKKLRYAILLKF